MRDLYVMMKTTMTVLLVAAGFTFAAAAVPFDGIEHDILDLKGGARTVAEISQKQWNGLKTVVSNGHLRVSDNYWMHGGLTAIGPRSTFSVGPRARLSTGIGDAGIRRFEMAEGSELRFDVTEWAMDHTQITVPKGAAWFADVGRLTLAGAMKDNSWDIAGKAMLVRGVNVADCKWGCELAVTLRPGGELWLGGPVAFKGEKGGLSLTLAGGKVVLFWDGAFSPGLARVAPGAEVVVETAPGVSFDVRTLDVPADAKVVVKKLARMPAGLPARYTFAVHADAHNRSYYISADAFRESVRELVFRYPNPDAESPLKTLEERPTDTIFRKRFPAGAGPWTVMARVTDVHGDTYSTNIVVRKTSSPKRPPAPNDLVMVGMCGYDDAVDLQADILKEDLCNLYVGWHSAGKTLGDKLPENLRGAWRQAVTNRQLWSMSIYSGDGADVQAKLRELYGARYLGNNVGEYASYLYQDDGCRPKSIPNDRDLLASKNHLVNRYVHDIPTGWQGRFPYSFSTCGAALSCYELAGGVDFICNEQWAIGAQNLAHTSAEARGAARKWGPEYWCAWNAHEWQTCAIPYRTDQKFDSCWVGYLQEYVFGTSIIVLESGTQGTQAWKYTSAYPGQPKEERAQEGYGGEAAKRYRAVTKRFHDWVKANPRDAGTPETKIAMALGNLDAYLGMNGDFAVWAQHANAATNKLWRYGAPEHTQCMLEDLFFPRSPRALEPYGNSWLAGTPFGQVDVVNVDDETTRADLRRYELLVFGGWNTMTPQQRDVLEGYVKSGGTLVMSRPELTTRVDRDYAGYTDRDLLAPFGLLPPEGGPGEYVEKKFGRGRYFLFTAREFPAANDAAKKSYRDLVARLAREVRQTVTISADDDDTLACITYAVYPRKIYFLNVDTRHPRAFTWKCGGVSRAITLAPCEIRTVAR